ncbi:acid phosphatase [beta proteobacterium AAP99]|nr:acid phosphatase [beta proteobacterium AAP99]
MRPSLIALALAGALGACSSTADPAALGPTQSLQANVKTVVVIYAENEGFDKLYGNFPGANGVPVGTAYIPQTERNSDTPLPTLPQTWGGVTAAGQSPVITQAQSAGLTNAPFMIETAFQSAAGAPLTQGVITRDLYHRFFENQMQINGGKNDKFAAYSDAGGLTMGRYDGSQMALWRIAQQYVLADNFFQGAFGGSFLNHQYLVCACAPEYPNADTAAAKPTIAALKTDANGNYLPALAQAANSPASAMDGPPVYVLSGNIAPKNYFGDGTFRAINTMQPPFQPSGNAPAAADTTGQYADPAKATTLPAQTQQNIGDLLNAKGVNWAWYSGAWNSSLASRTGIYSGGTPNFQPHHQPFNYYANFDPVKNAADRTAHLKDYTDLVSDAAAGKLPPVVFYKPQGNLNQHPGYTDVTSGDAHIADTIAKLQASPQWANMVIVVTYDENGGAWDHVAPPKGDLLGPGSRIPALVISPFSAGGGVDKTPYDTASVLRLITKVFGLPMLPGLAARDAALVANGGKPMGDLTAALKLPARP